MYEVYRNLAQRLGLDCEPPDEPNRVDQGGVTHESTVQAVAQETGVALGTSRIRVGVSRGHLLEVVLLVPLDVGADEETLQIAAEAYLEGRLGTALLDEWVGSVAVDRIARTSGLMVVSDGRSSAPSHPLSEGTDLVRLGIEGIVSQLPDSLLVGPNSGADWIALEFESTKSGLQSDRRFASTRFPEALKCALEGSPFRSSRFTRGDERHCWLSWVGPALLTERVALRERIEGRLFDAEHGGRLLVSGTGFGVKRDYVDLWLHLTWAGLPEFLLGIAEDVGELDFGVYDMPLCRRPLRVVAPFHG